MLRDGLQSVCKRGTAHPSWAVCGCQTSGVHSRDGGKVAGLAGRGLEFETPLLTFMQAGHNNLVSRCLISLHHEADDEDMPIGRAASVKHTYKGQQDRTQWRHEVMTGLRAHPQKWYQKASVAVEPHLGIPGPPGTCSDAREASVAVFPGPANGRFSL